MNTLTTPFGGHVLEVLTYRAERGNRLNPNHTLAVEVVVEDSTGTYRERHFADRLIVRRAA